MKKTIILTILLLIGGFSLKAQMYYPADTKDIEECIYFLEKPLGTEISYRAKSKKKWTIIKMLNKPKMGGVYLVQFPNKAREKLNVSEGKMYIKNPVTGKTIIFENKSLYINKDDKTDYLDVGYVQRAQMAAFLASITQKGITQYFSIAEEDSTNLIYKLTLQEQEGIYTLKRIDNDYELTLPNGTKKLYQMDSRSSE